jgi:PAS domain S-box-containing protein
MSAASIGLDVRLRSEVALVNHTLEVSNQLAGMRLLLRRAESAERGYLLTGDRYFLTEYHQSLDAATPAFAGLREMLKDNVAQLELLASSEPLVMGRLAAASAAILLHSARDAAGPAVKTDGRARTASVDAKFDRLAKEEQRLLAIRSLDSAGTGSLLLVVDLICAALILILAAILVVEGRRSSRKLEVALRATNVANLSLETSVAAKKTENEQLEGAVADQSRSLLKAQESVRISISVLESTFTSMAEAVIVINGNGSIMLANPAAERLLHCHAGMTVDRLMAENVAFHTGGSAELDISERPEVRALRGERIDELEIDVRHAGDRNLTHLVVSAHPLLDAAGAVNGAALVLHDVTDARETARRLRQSQKLDAIGKLTGGIAHDFNNMLTVIAGTTEILAAELDDKPELQAVAALINQATDRCTELIKHLLAFARKQPLQPRNVDINASLVDIARLLRPTLGEHIHVDSVLQKGAPTALIDPSQLASALLNLAINARDAMPNGGKLMLETASVLLDESYARSNADVRPGPYVMIAVSDTGSGMSAAMCEKVFEPFFTTKGAGKGTGLGLSMVYGFTRQSGGHVKIYSEEGHGTTIKLYLPAASGSADAPAPRVEPAPGAGETILVVEDDALVRGFVIAQLHSLGYRTVAASDGRAALEYVESGRPFDLLFTDVVMPGGMTGRQLADKAASLQPGTKVLYTSGYSESAIVHHGRLDQGVRLLSKPYRKSDLANMVRLAFDDAAVGSLEANLTRLADTSIEAPALRQTADPRAPS